jgi:regulatory protein
MVYDEGMTETPPRSRGRTRRITAASLENAALYYLRRFDSTAENLRRVLSRRVRRAAMSPQATIDTAEAARWIEAVVAKMTRLGYVDDARTAAMKARSLFARGTPPAMIRRRLALLGAGEEAIDAALSGIEEDCADAELTAAAALARRRRLGPFRPAAARAERRDKDMAALARAGFSPEIARRVIDAADPEDLQEDIRPAD